MTDTETLQRDAAVYPMTPAKIHTFPLSPEDSTNPIEVSFHVSPEQGITNCVVLVSEYQSGGETHVEQMPLNFDDALELTKRLQEVLLTPTVRGRYRGYWTEERIIDAARRWYRLVGESPSTGDWQNQSNGNPYRRSIYRSGVYPPAAVVYTVFGKWSLMLSAAGLQPNNRAVKHRGTKSKKKTGVG